MLATGIDVGAVAACAGGASERLVVVDIEGTCGESGFCGATFSGRSCSGGRRGVVRFGVIACSVMSSVIDLD